MEWRQFVMDLDTLNPEVVEAILARHGAQSITFTGADADPVLETSPGEVRLWRDSRITALFAADFDAARLTDDLQRTLGLRTLPAHHVEELEERIWEREWLKGAVPMRFGNRLWICPGETHIAAAHAVVLRIDPGLAFGTGSHATTALCLEWLDGQHLNELTMLDYGCGSGVLAIAALRLGCTSAWGVDIDPQAVQAARANAVLNGVDDRLTVVGDVKEIDGGFDIVIANVLAEPLISNASTIAAWVKNGGSLVLSGILSGQVNALADAYGEWIEFDDPVYRLQDGQTWTILAGSKIEN